MESDGSKSLVHLLHVLTGQIEDGTRTLSQLEMFIEGRNPFLTRGDVAFKMDMLAGWEKFFLEFFKVKVDLSGMAIPVIQGDGYSLIVNAVHGYNSAIENIRRHFNVWVNPGLGDLDENMMPDIRQAKDTPYAILFKPDNYSIPESIFHDAKCASKIDFNQQNGITLIERLIFEVKYWSETGRHPEDAGLDQVKWSKCSGSRLKNGGIPHIIWRGNSLDIDIR